jgi:hypothetical protein
MPQYEAIYVVMPPTDDASDPIVFADYKQAREYAQLVGSPSVVESFVHSESEGAAVIRDEREQLDA